MNDTIQDYIRIGHTASGSFDNYVCNDLQNFPTPSGLAYSLNDVDKDPFTDLIGFTHRNRVRTDVLGLELSYSYLAPEVQSYLLKRIEPEWFYVEVISPKHNYRKIFKMYASAKTTEVMRAKKDENGNWRNEYVSFSVSFVEE